MFLPIALFSLLLSLYILPSANAGVTIYTTIATPEPSGFGTATSIDPAIPTTLDAYNTVVLTPPAVPSPAPATNFDIQLYPGGMANLSLPQLGNFVGFSIELSVSNQVLGRNSSLINVPFLNCLANLKARNNQGAAIRVGGNSQEGSILFGPNGFGNYRALNKTTVVANDPTATPDIDYDPDIFTLMLHISELVGTSWFFGLPFANASNTTGISDIAATSENVLGDYLLALQLGNEPDMYDVNSRRRTAPYTIADFMNEWGNTISAMEADTEIPREMILLGPSVCCDIADWGINDLITAGFVTQFVNQLEYFSVQHYYTNNCGATPINGQTMVDAYFTHANPVGLVQPYMYACSVAQAAGKPCIMFETNTASCGGFAGLSDSFGTALWGLDYALQAAYGNFTNLLYHTGGQDEAYNPFTSPPTNLSKTHQWTFGPLYYTALAAAEVFGPTNQSRVVDLFANANNDYTPAYAIYENDEPTKVALFNYVDDLGTGANAITVNIAIGGGDTGDASTTPTSVSVRYLLAQSVATKYNMTWAGQTMGPLLEADGILRGDVYTETVTCTGGSCPVIVPAPGFALVFLTPQALADATPPSSDSTFTFPTTTGKTDATATIDAAVLATSNGRGGIAQNAFLASTSKEKVSWAVRRRRGAEGVLVLGAVCVGALGAGFLGWSFVR